MSYILLFLALFLQLNASGYTDDNPQNNCAQTVTGEYGLSHTEGVEPVENITTWVFEEGSFRPAAKLTKDKNYSIITDYLGTPVQMYDEKGQLVWETHLDIYGKVRTFAGRSLSDCPFRYQGQYEDSETGLYYNRFRYYSPEEGMYLSQDPIGLAGGMMLYGYVKNSNTYIDIAGLSDSSKLASALGTLPGKNYDAHHIVMANSTDSRMETLRSQMAKFDPPIDKNSKENGIWMPRTDADRLQGTATTAHKQKGNGIHSDAYKQDIFDRLNGKNRQEFSDELKRIKGELEGGRTLNCK